MHITSLFLYTQKLEEVLNLVSFFHFTFANLPRCSQSMKSLIYIYTLYRSPADHRHDHTSLYYQHPKRFSALTPDGSSFLTLASPPTKAGFPLQGSQGICQRMRKSKGNLIYFGKSQGKVREEKFYPCKFLTFKKTMHAEMCAVELYMTVSCI